MSAKPRVRVGQVWSRPGDHLPEERVLFQVVDMGLRYAVVRRTDAPKRRQPHVIQLVQLTGNRRYQLEASQ